MLTKIATLADDPRVDWLGLALAVGAVVAGFLGVDLDAYDILVGTVLAALGRGSLITAKRRAQQAQLVEIATSTKQAIDAFRPEDRQG